MKAVAFLVLAFSIQIAARADFSYTSTRKTTGGAMAAMAGAAGNSVSKVYFKGQKMRTEDGDVATQIDFEAQTVTTIDNARRTYTVRNFSDVMGAAPNTPSVTMEAKETGQRKSINGFDAKELILTMDMDMSQMMQGRGGAAGMGGMNMKMQMEVDMWISSEVPGGGEVRAFYERNAARFPWTAMGANNNPGMASAMAEIQKKISSMDGVTVEQIIRVKQAGGAAMQMPGMQGMPQMSQAQQDQMAQARARLEAMQAQGGPAAAAAQQALARMGAMGGAAAPAGAGGAGSLIEMTVDSTGFSGSAIPDSVFAIPAGYQKTDK
jgi:hypothetical protein